MNTDNIQMQLDPELAKKLFAEGAVLVIAGVPVGTQFGIDLCSYTIAENFRGVKMIPPGAHYVWCASHGPYGDVAPRVGFVHYFKTNELIVREWDHDNEELRERQIENPDLEKQRIKQNLQQLDRFLAPYDYRYISEWKHLTDTITEAGVERCRPEFGTIRTNIELQSCPDAERPRGEIKTIQAQKAKLISDENELLPKLKPIDGTAPRFTTLPDRVPKDAQAADISKHAMDCIAAVDLLMQSFQYKPQDLIEEIQLSFAFFLIGYSVESLSQWRKLLSLLSHSETAIGKYKLLFMKYSEVLAQQLPHLPEELMEPTAHNTVYKDTRSLLLNLYAGDLSVSAERLVKHLRKKLQWHFDDLLDDDPEDQPVILETLD